MIEDYLTKNFYQKMKKAVKNRVSDARYSHIKSVAKTSKWIAEIYDLDVRKCMLAAILHDWDKGLTVEEEVEKARRLGLQSTFDPWVMEHLPNLLHGPTAATEIVQNFNNFPQDVAHAIFVHTTADFDMNDIDMCLYVADAIEPTREYDELRDLRDMVGKVSLKDLYESVFRLWTIKLILQEKLIYPKTLKIYNNLIMEKI